MLSMLSVVLGLALALPVNKEATQYFIEVTIYQGNPNGAKERLSSPQIVTRNGQQALISVGQMVPMVTDIKSQVGKKVTTVTQEQVGIIIKLTPKTQEDGSIFVTCNTSIKEAISDSAIVEHNLNFNQLFQPGAMEMVRFYPVKEPFSDKAPYSGKEMWMEMTVHDVKSDKAKQILRQNEKEAAKPGLR